MRFCAERKTMKPDKMEPQEGENLTDWSQRVAPWLFEVLAENGGVDGAMRVVMAEVKGRVNHSFVMGLLCGIEIFRMPQNDKEEA